MEVAESRNTKACTNRSPQRQATAPAAAHSSSTRPPAPTPLGIRSSKGAHITAVGGQGSHHPRSGQQHSGGHLGPQPAT